MPHLLRQQDPSAASATPVVEEPKEVSPEHLARIEQQKGEMVALAEELVVLEELPEVQDSDFDTEEAIEDMLRMVKGAGR